jgi:hypothetical protein
VIDAQPLLTANISNNAGFIQIFIIGIPFFMYFVSS